MNRIDANRANAKKSTGPRTPAGKAASSRNGMTHALTGKNHLLPDEDPAEFQLLLDDHNRRFRPVGPAEEKLVIRIAAGQWRLDRAFTTEAGIYRKHLKSVDAEDERILENHAAHTKNALYRGEPAPPPPPQPDEGDRLGRAFKFDCAGHQELSLLVRYETAIERSIDRSLRQLKAFQSARMAAAPAPQEPASTYSKEEDCEANPKCAPFTTADSVSFAPPGQKPAPPAHPTSGIGESTECGGPNDRNR